MLATLTQKFGKSLSLFLHLSNAAKPNRYILLEGGFFKASRMNRKASVSDMYLQREREREREREGGIRTKTKVDIFRSIQH